MQMRCAWAGCTETYPGRLPSGWTFLVTFRQELGIAGILDFRRDKVIRDAVLCAAHSQALLI
jgi:hypothetical protein